MIDLLRVRRPDTNLDCPMTGVRLELALKAFGAPTFFTFEIVQDLFTNVSGFDSNRERT